MQKRSPQYFKHILACGEFGVSRYLAIFKLGLLQTIGKVLKIKILWWGFIEET
jgi:hypothetical protein